MKDDRVPRIRSAIVLKSPKDLVPKEAVSRIRGSARHIWLAGLGAYAMAEEHGAKVFASLVKQGEEAASRTRKATEGKTSEVQLKARGTRDTLGAMVQRQLSRGLNRLGIFTRNDLQDLSQRIDDLNKNLGKIGGAVKPQKA